MKLSVQQQFNADWGDLNDPHVRALAWLLTSPHLLHPGAPIWNGANIAPVLPDAPVLRSFLRSLDLNPAPLHAALVKHPTKRLGLYAETLLAFFLSSVVIYMHMDCKFMMIKPEP